MLRLIVIVLIVLQYMTVAFHYNNNNNNIIRTRNNLQPLNVLIKNETPKLTKFPSSLSNFNEKLVGSVKKLLILLYSDDSIYARFAALETIARVPYFAYISCLHLRETLGQRNEKTNLARIHFDETENEQVHLLIMESLGGNKEFSHRFYSQHIAVFYYWIVVVIYLLFPSACYDLNYHVEKHAYQTYDQFLNEEGDKLKNLPAPIVAVQYYNVSTLYDVFVNIRNDELEHSNMMYELREEFMKNNDE